MVSMGDREAGQTSIHLFAIYTLSRLVGFVGLIYFTRQLSKELLGVYFLFFLIIQVSSMMSNLGLREGVVTKVGEGERPDATLSAALATVSLVSLLIGSIVFASRAPLTNYIGADVPLLISVASASWLFSDMYKSALQAEDRVLTSGLLQLSEDILRVLVGGLLITIGWGPRGLMVGIIIGFLGTTLIGISLSSLSMVIPQWRDFRQLFSVSRYTMVYGPTNFAYFWLDTYMIGLLLGQAAVSSYEIGWQTTRVLIIATTAISTTIFPKIPRWASEDAYEEIERIVPGALLFTLVFPIPGFVGLSVLAPEVLTLVYTPEYINAAVPMAILAGYMIVEAIQRVSSPILTGIERADVPFKSRLLGVTIALLFNVLLIPQYGLTGAAVATLTAKLVDTIIQWVAVYSILEIDIPSRSLGWELLSAGIMGIGVYGSAQVLQPSTLLELAVTVILGVGVYSVLVVQDDEIRNVVEQYIPFKIPV
jgi:O-antigen/teichoic acid export membrane protein